MSTDIIKINKQIVSKDSTQIVSSSIGGALLRVRQDFYGLGLIALNMCLYYLIFCEDIRLGNTTVS
jgi:hypothetical protein